MGDQDALVPALRATLEREADHAPVADLTWSSVRRAGRIRTRRRVIAGSVAAVILAVGIPLGSSLFGDADGDSGQLEIATSPPPAPQATHTILPNALIPTDKVNPVGTMSGLQRFESASLAQGRWERQCLTALRKPGAEDRQIGYWVADGEVVEAVLQMPTVASAKKLMHDHRKPCDTAPPGAITVDGADEAIAWTVASNRSFDAVGMARSANVVIVLTLGATSDPTSGGWDIYASRTLATANDQAL